MSTPAIVRQMARECVAVRVRLLNRLITKVCDEGLRPFGVRVAQVNILVAVAHDGPLTPNEVAKRLETRTGATAIAPPEPTRVEHTCAACATVNDPDARFCKTCGQKL